MIELPTYVTPVSDIVPPTITDDHPAVETPGMANKDIASVKAALFGS